MVCSGGEQQIEKHLPSRQLGLIRNKNIIFEMHQNPLKSCYAASFETEHVRSGVGIYTSSQPQSLL